MNTNLKKIFNLMDNIIERFSSNIEKIILSPSDLDREGNKLQNKNLDMIFNFTKSYLPALKNEFGVFGDIFNDENVFKLIHESLNAIDGNLIDIYENNSDKNIRINNLLDQITDINGLRRDFRLVRIAYSNFEERFENLKENLIIKNSEQFEAEVVSAKDKFDKAIKDSKNRYESEIKKLELKLKTIFDNTDEKFRDLFDFYKSELGIIRKNDLEQNKSRVDEFKEFMEDYKGEKDFMIKELNGEKNLLFQTIKDEKDGLVEKFEKSFNKIQTDWKRIQQIKTENVYLNAYHKNTARSKNSENKFIAVTALSLFLSVLTIIAFIFKAIDFSQFISIKIMIVVFFGILIAYYLRISTHYRRLADQAEQTHLELLAFPQYAAELGEEKSREIKEQLALKYFGKEIDASGYQKISDIAQEQLKTSSELVKAAASLSVASTKTSGGAQNNDDNEAQKNSNLSGKK